MNGCTPVINSLSSPYPSTSFLRQAQDRQGERTGKMFFDKLRSIGSERMD
ncbi:MAG: hypothetical protein LBD67_03780 [Candidatus Accumulibacter sp.]|nr:hypothetical protein [Accumulibacter sp.]